MALVERGQARAPPASAAAPRPAPAPGGGGGGAGADSARPSNVGILAMEVYFPLHYVDQADLEAADGAPAGKYTTGLGQRALAFVDGDSEDAASMALSALAALLEKTGTDPARVGWLSVGSESAPDRSKSLKTSLMRLFADAGNHDVQGVDAVNACYGGTAAVLAAAAWVESAGWDGRLAAVVAADIAAYAPGPARPSGGCGAVAMLVGPGAPLVLEPGLVATHARDEWDFWRPAGGRDPWPRVDAPRSVACYLACLDACYAGLVGRAAKVSAGAHHPPPLPPRWPAPHPSRAFSLSTGAAYFVAHAPYGKLVRKAFARLVATDARRAAGAGAAAAADGQDASPSSIVGPPPDYDEREAVPASSDAFEAVVGPGAWLAAEVGNMYTASVWAGLAALVERAGRAGLDGHRVLLFSYGSGAVASLLALRCREGGGRGGGPFTLSAMAASLHIAARLAGRARRSPADLDASLALAAAHHTDGPGPAGWEPAGGGAEARVRPGAFYLAGVDALARRSYARRRRPEEGGGGGGGRAATANGGSHAASAS